MPKTHEDMHQFNMKRLPSLAGCSNEYCYAVLAIFLMLWYYNYAQRVDIGTNKGRWVLFLAPEQLSHCLSTED